MLKICIEILMNCFVSFLFGLFQASFKHEDKVDLFTVECTRVPQWKCAYIVYAILSLMSEYLVNLFACFLY